MINAEIFADMTLYKIKSLVPKTIRQRLYFLLPYINKLGGKKMHSLLQSFVRPGDLVFDIGANAGLLTDCFLKFGAKVVSLEPHPVSFAVLAERFKNNPNAILVNKGVADAEAELDFYLSDNASGISSFSKKVWEDQRFQNISWNRTVKVKATTLDRLIGEYGLPKYCKIDVEGFEWPVLKGLHQKIKYISFEISENYFEDLKLIIRHLDSLGDAKYNFSMSAYYELESGRWLASGELFAKLEHYKGKDFYGDMYVMFN